MTPSLMKENTEERSNSSNIEELHKLISASLELQRQTFDKLASIDSRLTAVENKILTPLAPIPIPAAAPAPAPAKALDPTAVLQLQKQIADCIQAIHRRLQTLQESATISKSTNTPSIYDPNRFTSLQEEMMSWLLTSKEEQQASLGDLTDLQQNMLCWVLQSESIKKAVPSIELPVAVSDQLPIELEEEARRFTQELREQSRAVEPTKEFIQMPVDNTNRTPVETTAIIVRQEDDMNDQDINIMDIGERNAADEEKKTADKGDQNQNKTQTEDTDLDNMSVDTVIDPPLLPIRDITFQKMKEVTGHKGPLSASKGLKSVVAILLGERLGRKVLITEPCVDIEISKVRALGIKVYRHMVEAIARNYFKSTVSRVTTLAWSKVPGKIKIQYFLLLERNSLQKNNLDIARCENHWAANALLRHAHLLKHNL